MLVGSWAMSQLASQYVIATPTSNPLPSCTAILVGHIACTSHCCCWSKHFVTSYNSRDKTSSDSWHLIHHIRTIQRGVVLIGRVINISVTKMRSCPLSLSLSGWPDEKLNELNLILLMIYWEFLFPIIKS